MLGPIVEFLLYTGLVLFLTSEGKRLVTTQWLTFLSICFGFAVFALFAWLVPELWALRMYRVLLVLSSVFFGWLFYRLGALLLVRYYRSQSNR